MSLPTWERGLKSIQYFNLLLQLNVAPYMGAWIEIISIPYFFFSDFVAPYMGAWIEIQKHGTGNRQYTVAPYMGAWIEIC